MNSSGPSTDPWGTPSEIALSCDLWLPTCDYRVYHTIAYYHKPSPKAFQRIWLYIQPASQKQTTCNHTSPGPPHPASSPRSSETSQLDSWCNNKLETTLERCSLHGWIPVFTVQGRWQTVCNGWAVYWCQRCESSGPWWRWQTIWLKWLPMRE